MRAGRHRADNAKGRVFFQRDAVIAAAAIRPEPVHAGNKLDDLEFRNLVVKPADFRFVQFELAHDSAFFSARVLTISSILRRAPTPFCFNCR